MVAIPLAGKRKDETAGRVEKRLVKLYVKPVRLLLASTPLISLCHAIYLVPLSVFFRDSPYTFFSLAKRISSSLCVVLLIF